MEKFIPSKLTKKDLQKLINLKEQGIDNYSWLNVEEININEYEQQQINHIKLHLINYPTLLMNEATIWSRAIYPFLLLVENQKIQAWSEVFLQAKYQNFELEGIADGVIGKCVSSSMEAPYLIIVEAKRGLEAQNPIYQLYGQLLIAGHLNWENNNQQSQEIYGAYTIADIWTFIKATIEGIDLEKPTAIFESSKEYSSQLEAETILKIIKKIINKQINHI